MRKHVVTASLNFGTVMAGQGKTLADNIVNNTAGSVTVTQATVSGSEFKISGISFPVTLGSGHSTALNVTFTPQAAWDRDRRAC